MNTPLPTSDDHGNIYIRPHQDSKVKALTLFFGLCIAVIVGLAMVVTFRAQSHQDRMASDLRNAEATIQELSGQIETLRAEGTAIAAVTACRVRFQLDVTIASAEATATFNSTFAQILNLLVTPLPQTASEPDRTERRRQLQELSEQMALPSDAYVEATEAYAGYLALQPPPEVCPHP